MKLFGSAAAGISEDGRDRLEKQQYWSRIIKLAEQLNVPPMPLKQQGYGLYVRGGDDVSYDLIAMIEALADKKPNP